MHYFLKTRGSRRSLSVFLHPCLPLAALPQPWPAAHIPLPSPNHKFESTTSRSGTTVPVRKDGLPLGIFVPQMDSRKLCMVVSEFWETPMIPTGRPLVGRVSRAEPSITVGGIRRLRLHIFHRNHPTWDPAHGCWNTPTNIDDCIIETYVPRRVLPPARISSS